jgi:hypothetical protein
MVCSFSLRIFQPVNVGIKSGGLKMNFAIKYSIFILFFMHINATSMEFTGDIELLSKTFFCCKFHGSDFSKVNLIGQNLSGADFTGANLSEANLIGTILKNVKMDKQTKYDNAIGWSGNIEIQKYGKDVRFTPIDGDKIIIDKAWLLRQGVIFVDE